MRWGSLDAIQLCIGDLNEFLADYKAKRPRLRRADQTGGDFTDLLSTVEVDRLIATSGLRTPLFRLIKNGAALPPERFTKSAKIGDETITGLADPARVFVALDEGATLVLDGLHRYHEAAGLLVRSFEWTLGHPCQANAYVTPPMSTGLSIHSDSHDVVVLQCFGNKKWQVLGPDGPWDFVLQPGDALYLPRDTPHAASAEEGLSGHLTVGILAETWRTVITNVVQHLLADEAFDDRLPVGWHKEPRILSDALQSRIDILREKLGTADLDAEAVGRSETFLSQRAPVLTGGLLDRRHIPNLHDAAVVRRRPTALFQMNRESDHLILLLGDRQIRMPVWMEESIEMLASGKDVRVGDLSIDASSRLLLVKRLIREGLLEFADSGSSSMGSPRAR